MWTLSRYQTILTIFVIRDTCFLCAANKSILLTAVRKRACVDSYTRSNFSMDFIYEVVDLDGPRILF